MNRKGITDFIIKLIITLAIMLAVVIFLIGEQAYGGITNKFNNAIPWFRETPPQTTGATGAVGVDLSEKELRLKYYNGNEFVSPSADSETLKLKNLELSLGDTRQRIIEFYFNTERKSPSVFYNEDNSRKLSIVKRIPLIRFYERIPAKRGEPGGGLKVDKGYYMEISGEINNGAIWNIPKEFLYLRINDLLYIRDFNNIRKLNREENDIYEGYLPEVIKWRDEILYKGKCEKHITLKFKENGMDVEKNYTVTPIYPYLVVELGRSVEGEDAYSKCVDEKEKEVEEQQLPLLDSAFLVANMLEGSYIENKQFIDLLYARHVIDEEEYKEINGEGLFNNQEDMRYVEELLATKKNLRDNMKGKSYYIIRAYGEFYIYLGTIDSKGYYSGLYNIGLFISGSNINYKSSGSVGFINSDGKFDISDNLPSQLSEPDISFIRYLEGKPYSDVSEGKIKYEIEGR